MECNGYRLWKSGAFNSIGFIGQVDGSTIVTIGSNISKDVYSFQVVGFGTPQETVVKILKGEKLWTLH